MTRLERALAVIAGITVTSGLGQLVAPGTVLDLMGAESTADTRHLFAIVGMFMAIIGALTLQALLTEPCPPYVLLWCAVQKFGAFVAVGVAVLRDLFTPLALGVAVFDLATALLAAALWWRLRADRPQRVGVPA